MGCSIEFLEQIRDNYVEELAKLEIAIQEAQIASYEFETMQSDQRVSRQPIGSLYNRKNHLIQEILNLNMILDGGSNLIYAR